MQTIDNFIAGEFSASTQPYLSGVEPATGQTIYHVANASEADLTNAITAAQAVQTEWAQTPVAQRVALLRRLAQLIERDLGLLAELESQDTGKCLHLATQLDIPRAAQNFHFFASAMEQFAETAYTSNQQALHYNLHQPLGIVACIAPWNLPLYLLTWKLAPALAAGNCVIAKPSELTVLSADHLARLSVEAGLPSGVLQVLHGQGQQIGQALCEHHAIKAVSFTGGTQTGAQIAATVAPHFKKYTLELGGKNASLVFADADIERIVPQIVRSSFANQGQVCLATSRILVERSIYSRFKQGFVDAVQALKVGDPLEASSEVGALISQAHQQKVLHYINLAKQEGAMILTGGEAVQVPGRCAQGYFVAPTVVEGLAPSALVNQQEVFGPFTALIPFADEAEAIAIANATPYGLAACVWTQQLARAHRVAAQLDSGMIWINSWLLRDLRTPFGGMKQSGVGREGGMDALAFFSESKSVCVNFQ